MSPFFILVSLSLFISRPSAPLSVFGSKCLQCLLFYVRRRRIKEIKINKISKFQKVWNVKRWKDRSECMIKELNILLVEWFQEVKNLSVSKCIECWCGLMSSIHLLHTRVELWHSLQGKYKENKWKYNVLLY